MIEKYHIHIIDPDAARRAFLARLSFEAGVHAEIFEDLTEWIKADPRFGVVLVHDEGKSSAIPELIGQVAQIGRWVPVIGYSSSPTINVVVNAIKGGALDFIPLPSEGAELACAVKSIQPEIERTRDAWARAVKARYSIARLSMRERQVLDGVVSGLSNKSIARDLDISPRTVEIHRMKMLGKLGARNAVDAVRLRAEASAYSVLAA